MEISLQHMFQSFKFWIHNRRQFLDHPLNFIRPLHECNSSRYSIFEGQIAKRSTRKGFNKGISTMRGMCGEGRQEFDF